MATTTERGLAGIYGCSSAINGYEGSGVAVSKEIELGTMADYDADGHLVGIEVCSVSRRSRAT